MPHITIDITRQPHITSSYQLYRFLKNLSTSSRLVVFNLSGLKFDELMDLIDIGRAVTYILRNICLKKSHFIDDTLSSTQVEP